MPNLQRELTEQEEHVVWACLWANVRDVHAPVYNLNADQLAVGHALFDELDARYMTDKSSISDDEREILLALMHGVLEHEVDAQVHDETRAEQLCDHYDQLINERRAPALANDAPPVPSATDDSSLQR